MNPAKGTFPGPQFVYFNAPAFLSSEHAAPVRIQPIRSTISQSKSDQPLTTVAAQQIPFRVPRKVCSPAAQQSHPQSPRPTHFQSFEQIQEIDEHKSVEQSTEAPTETTVDPVKPIEDSICRRLWWRILLGFILCFLLAVAIALPFLTLNVFITTTKITTTTTTTTQTTTTTSSSLPSQCSTASIITDSTRNVAYSVANYICDTSGSLATAGWYRFTGAGGTVLANYAVASLMCSTHAPGWYNGVNPSSAGTTVAGTVCYNWGGNSCTWSTAISVTNCNGYYVYNLSPPPVCNLRYCTM